MAEDAKQATAPQPVIPKTLTEKYGIWVVLAVTIVWPLLTSVLQNRGIITPDQKSTLDKGAQTILLVGENADGEVTLTEVPVEKPSVTPAAAKPSVVHAKPKPSADEPTKAITPDDIKQWTDLIRILIEQLKPPKPPTPIPDPQPPIPVPPRPPTPTPDPLPPLPGALKIVVTDEAGKPITSSVVEAGSLFVVTSTGTSVGWQSSRSGTVHLVTLPHDHGFAFTLESGASLELFASDFAARTQASVRITTNTGPRPPPEPQPPGPIPPQPEPPGPVVGALRVLIVHESSQSHTREQLNALNSTKLVEMLNRVCVKNSAGNPSWRKWDKDIDATKDDVFMRQLWADVKPKITTLPALVIAVGSRAIVHPLTTEAASLELINKAANP